MKTINWKVFYYNVPNPIKLLFVVQSEHFSESQHKLNEYSSDLRHIYGLSKLKSCFSCCFILLIFNISFILHIADYCRETLN